MSEAETPAVEPAALRLDADGIPILEDMVTEAADAGPVEAVPLLFDRAGLQRLAGEIATRIATEMAREFETELKDRLERELISRLPGVGAETPRAQ